MTCKVNDVLPIVGCRVSKRLQKHANVVNFLRMTSAKLPKEGLYRLLQITETERSLIERRLPLSQSGARP